MKDLTLCATTFLVTLALACINPTSLGVENMLIPEQRFTLMECDTLAAENYTVELEDRRYKAAAICFFGGYYPLSPTTEF